MGSARFVSLQNETSFLMVSDWSKTHILSPKFHIAGCQSIKINQLYIKNNQKLLHLEKINTNFVAKRNLTPLIKKPLSVAFRNKEQT